MNCKNCDQVLIESANYCNHCGAQVVLNRITFKEMTSQTVGKFFGWDNAFFRTVKALIINPRIIFEEYLNGTRKKYFQPIAFLTFCSSISLIFFNIFTEQFFEQSNLAFTSGSLTDAGSENNLTNEGYVEFQEFFLKYFILFSFLFLPFYSYISRFIYGKKHNFGEHLVLNAYIQGLIVLITLVFFLLSLLTDANIYYISLLTYVIYYPYAFSRFYRHTPIQATLKILKFTLLIASFPLLSYGLGYAVGKLSSIG